MMLLGCTTCERGIIPNGSGPSLKTMNLGVKPSRSNETMAFLPRKAGKKSGKQSKRGIPRRPEPSRDPPSASERMRLHSETHRDTSGADAKAGYQLSCSLTRKQKRQSSK